jgi:polyphosphate kinase 2
MTDEDYAEQLRELQIALVRTQIELIAKSAKVLVIFEGRDAAGKDGVIKRITEHLSPRSTHMAALPKPSDRERSQWYFQRYAAHLPACGEVVLFNRSWYNRGGVEPVMGFCTPEEHADFLRDAPNFEHMLIEANIKLIKFWLDISKDEQAERLEARRTDPLKTLKVSPLDAEAQNRWTAYSDARDEMLMATSTLEAPWFCVRNNKKKAGRIALICHLLREIAPNKIAKKIDAPDPSILFRFEPEALKDGRLER